MQSRHKIIPSSGCANEDIDLTKSLAFWRAFARHEVAKVALN